MLVKLNITETRTFKHKVTVRPPEGMTKEQLHDILDDLDGQEQDDLGDLTQYELGKHKISEVSRSIDDCGTAEFEFDDVTVIEG